MKKVNIKINLSNENNQKKEIFNDQSTKHNDQNIDKLKNKKLEAQFKKELKELKEKKEKKDKKDIKPDNLIKENVVEFENRLQNDSKLKKNNEENDDDKVIFEIMGFSKFNSTNGKHVVGTKGGFKKKITKTNYRQYMNRKKGFKTTQPISN